MGIAAQQKVREFEFSRKQFDYLRVLVKTKTGINLSEAKYDMVYGRLARRLRALDLSSFGAYLKLLEREGSNELPELINAITTNLTFFFRENHHFEYLKNEALPEIANRSNTNKLRIWSAGCSTGEEPYSIAMTVLDSVVGKARWDTKILATDLDSNVVAHGKQGRYRPDRFDGMAKGILNKWFDATQFGGNDMFQAKAALQSLITFKELNLLHQWPMRGPFDVIFCRNVVIYFDKDTQRVLFDRYADLLAPGGYLFIGHSETLYRVSDRFESLGGTIYRKKG